METTDTNNVIDSLITSQENELDEKCSTAEYIGTCYNIIMLKTERKKNTYNDCKKFVHKYIQLVNNDDSNYGYDLINKEKIEKLVLSLEYEKQISLLKYFSSLLSKELPEYNKEWITNMIKTIEIKKIFKQKEFKLFPKAFLLISSYNIFRIIITLILFVIFFYIILLPAPIELMSLYNITYENYTSDFYVNHLVNIITKIIDIDSNFQIVPKNLTGIILIIIGKIIFITFIVSFIYKKITSKIENK